MSDFKKGVLGSIVLVGESLLNKIIGLISTLILARVLMPEDFGIVAIALLTIGFVEILAQTGSQQYLLRKDDINESQVNTSWTINLIIRFSLCLLMFGASFLAAHFYNDGRLILLIQTLALIFLLTGLGNPGIIHLKRKQEYQQIVKVNIFGKLLAVFTAVSIAVYFKSYWALVASQAVTAIVGLVGSYLIYPYKPKFILSNARDQWSFSGWMIPQSILGYFRTQLDTILVSALFGKADLGSYHTMKYLAYIPSISFIVPMTETFLVEMRKATVDTTYFNNVFTASMIITLLLAAPIAAFLFHFHELTTLLLLGENWSEYSHLLAIFGMLIPAAAIHRHCVRTLIIFNKPKHILMYELATFFIIYCVLFFIGINDLFLFTYVRVGMEQIASLSFLLYTSCKYTSLHVSLKLFFGIILIFGCCILSIFLMTLTPKFANDLINFVWMTSCFFVIFYSLIGACYACALRHFSEWQYIRSLLTRLLLPILTKIRYS